MQLLDSLALSVIVVIETSYLFERTNKEYLVNSQILLRYFDLIFFQLQLLTVLWKFIVIVNGPS